MVPRNSSTYITAVCSDSMGAMPIKLPQNLPYTMSKHDRSCPKGGCSSWLQRGKGKVR